MTAARITIRGPWYVTRKAVEQFCAVCKIDAENDDEFARAEELLIEQTKAARHVRNQANGIQLYRGPSPKRLRFLVAVGKRDEGELPQLVTVLPTHDGLRS